MARERARQLLQDRGDGRQGSKEGEKGGSEGEQERQIATREAAECCQQDLAVSRALAAPPLPEDDEGTLLEF